MLFKSATTKLHSLRGGSRGSHDDEYLERVRDNIQYEQLIQRTMEAQRRAQAAVDGAFPSLQKAVKKRQRTRLIIQGEVDTLAALSEDGLDDGIALYHAAIRPAQPQTTTIDRAPLALTSNRNCSIDILNMPAGTTKSMVLDAIAKFRPVGEIYDTHLTQIRVDEHNRPLKNDPAWDHPVLANGGGGGDGGGRDPGRAHETYYQHVKHVCAARIRFKAAHSAARLFQIGNKPGLGLYVQGVRAVVVFTAHPRASTANEPGTRVVIVRGPKELVSPAHLRRVLWGADHGFFGAGSTQRVLVGPVDARGWREVEWRFTSFWSCAEVAYSLFRCAQYHHGWDCEVRFGKDPCA